MLHVVLHDTKLSFRLAEEKEEDENKEEEEPVHNQVEGIILILFEKIFESFHGLPCCIVAKVRNSGGGSQRHQAPWLKNLFKIATFAAERL